MTTAIIIVIAAIFYAATHIVGVLKHRDAKLTYLERDEENPHRVVNYIIPGLFRAPKKGFYPFAEEMVGDAIFVDLNGIVWSSKHFAKQLTDHAIENDYEDIRIFAISVGDKVARRLKSSANPELRQQVKRVVSYDINPCANTREVKPGFRLALHLGAPLFRTTVFLLGPIGYLNLIPGDQGTKADPNRHSLAEISSQLLAIGFENTGKFRWGSNIVISKNDTLLDNAAIAANAGSKLDNLPEFIQLIAGGHADIIGHRSNYLDALNDLGAFDDDYE